MRVAITGATGFVGSHLVREALARGAREVRVLARPGGNRQRLEGLDLQGLDLAVIEGDLTAPASLQALVTGTDAVFHCAAHYAIGARPRSRFFTVNVEGTRNLLLAAERARVPRVVYTSTVGVLGRPADAWAAADEETPDDARSHIGAYKQSKHAAEALARAAAERHDVVIVNPSTPVGPGDLKPTPTGAIIVDFLSGKLPAYLKTGLNWVDVRDVARGHFLALERGRRGRRYILGGVNRTLREFLALVAEVAGRRPPRVRLPFCVAYAAALVSEGLSRLTGHNPSVPLEGVRLARHPMYFCSARAERELGYTHAPLEVAVADAVRWFAAQGYVRPPARTTGADDA